MTPTKTSPLHWSWRGISLALVLGWMALIYFLSARSGAEVNDALVALAWLGLLRDVVGHLVLYGGLASLIMFSSWSWRSAGFREFRWVALAAVLALLYGLTDEYHQTFVPGRAATLKDIL
ncbi:MAG: VanZ family protein, partial [Dehalococcoidia bacterium]